MEKLCELFLAHLFCRAQVLQIVLECKTHYLLKSYSCIAQFPLTSDIISDIMETKKGDFVSE